MQILHALAITLMLPPYFHSLHSWAQSKFRVIRYPVISSKKAAVWQYRITKHSHFWMITLHIEIHR
jgi:isopenicillin N synthase-like dioxygenase